MQEYKTLSGAMFDEASRRQKIMQFSLDRMQRRLELVQLEILLVLSDNSATNRQCRQSCSTSKHPAILCSTAKTTSCHRDDLSCGLQPCISIPLSGFRV